MKFSKRPLNDKERQAGVELAIAVHYLIRKLDDIKDTTMFRHDLKASANHFHKMLERHARETVWQGQIDGSNDMGPAVEQIEQLSELLDLNMKKILVFK